MGSFLLLSVALTLGVDTDEPLAELPETDLAARAGTELAAGLGERDNEVEARTHFRRAVRYYEELQRRGVHNAMLFRNLGNAHFLSANIPEAILAYRRGLRLRPDDEDLRTALASARQGVYDPTDGTVGRPAEDGSLYWVEVFSPTRLFVLATILYLLAGLAAVRWLMKRSRWMLLFAILLVLSALVSRDLVKRQANRLAVEQVRSTHAAMRPTAHVPADGPLGRPPEETSPSWLQVVSPTRLVVLDATLYLLACLAAMRWWMNGSRWMLSVAILLLLPTVAATGLLWHQANRVADEQAHPLIVVRAAHTQLLQGNGPDYPPRYVTPARPGVEGRLLFERDGWLQIELASGEVGWVAVDQVIVDR